jgi:hypothetical protein
VRLKLNGTHQLLAYADDVNLLGDNLDTINTRKGTLTDSSKEFGLEINVEKTKYLLVAVWTPECKSKYSHKTDNLKMCHS